MTKKQEEVYLNKMYLDKIFLKLIRIFNTLFIISTGLSIPIILPEEWNISFCTIFLVGTIIVILNILYRINSFLIDKFILLEKREMEEIYKQARNINIKL